MLYCHVRYHIWGMDYLALLIKKNPGLGKENI
jgi:hypothetical protein